MEALVATAKQMITKCYSSFFLIGVELIYSILFQGHSKVIQLHIYIYPLLFRLSFLIDYYRILSKVPCAIKQVLVGHLFYI